MGRYEFFPPEHHDFYPTADIRRTAAHNEALTEAKFLGDLNHFRAETIEKLYQHTELRNTSIFAIFHEPTFEEYGDTHEHFGGKRTLMMLGIKPGQEEGSYLAPRISIITNEPIRANGVEQHLTMHFSSNDKDVVRYFVDAIDTDAQKPSETYAPLFQPSAEGNLLLSDNFHSIPQFVLLATKKKTSAPLAPFGAPRNVEDSIHALSIGTHLLMDVIDKEPVHVAKL